MTAHRSHNMASRFTESFSAAQISEINEAIPIDKKKATKFGLGILVPEYVFIL